MLSAFPDFLASLVFPPQCETCGAALSPRVPGLCASCRASISWLTPPFCAGCGRTYHGSGRCGLCGNARFHFDGAYACAVYSGTIREALHGYKFGRRKSLKVFFSGEMARFAETHLGSPGFESVAAVPLDAQRRRERGFNQSELLARRLARRFNVPDLSPDLKRRSSGRAQSTLGKTERKENIRGRFEASGHGAFSGRRVLLVDDVLTTGETASECARAMKEAGAASVTALACARGA